MEVCKDKAMCKYLKMNETETGRQRKECMSNLIMTLKISHAGKADSYE